MMRQRAKQKGSEKRIVQHAYKSMYIDELRWKMMMRRRKRKGKERCYKQCKCMEIQNSKGFAEPHPDCADASWSEKRTATKVKRRKQVGWKQMRENRRNERKWKTRKRSLDGMQRHQTGIFARPLGTDSIGMHNKEQFALVLLC